MRPNEVFLSHSSADQDFVTTLSAMMQKHGMPFWYSKINILGAKQWHDEIGAALTRCDWFLLIHSPNSVMSMWVKRELLFALQQDRFADKIVPVLYQPCDFSSLSWVLPSFQLIDFHRDFDNGCQELLRIWGSGYTP